LRAALQAAGSGQRVLLAVPDLHTWNTLRKSAHAARSRAKGAGSPALKALAEPSGYACRARLQALARDPARLPAEERAALLPLIAWADRHAAGPVADGRGFSPERARLLWSRVCCDAWSDDPAAQAARDEAAAAGVILVTHAALCAHAALEGALLPACDSVIVTGAHRFPDIAQSPAGAGRAASFFRLREALQLLRLSPERDEGIWNDLPPLPAGDEGKNEWKSRWFEPERQLQKFLQKAGRHAAKPASGGGDFRVRYTEPAALAFGADPAPVLEALKENEDFLQACAGACTSADAASSGGIRRAVQRVEARLRAFRTDFQSLCDARDAESVYWFEDVANPHKATLRAAPRDMEPFGDALRALFGGGAFVAPALLSGAQAPRDARWFLRAAGLTAPEPPVAVRRLPPREPAHGPRFLMTPSAPFLGSGDQAADFARFLAEAAGPFADRGVLVLCPSQTALRSLHAALRKEWGRAFPLWAQHADGNRDALLRLYASGRGGCVLSAEGLPGLRDADGRAPALWVVARMPLPPPRDPLLEARGEVLREEGRNARLELWHPAAILRVKREWSVLCRSGSRPEAVWLLDGRAAAEGLGARLAGALGCEAEAVRDVAELRERTEMSAQRHNGTTAEQQ
jgi:Rad3-related DNA helicase